MCVSWEGEGRCEHGLWSVRQLTVVKCCQLPDLVELCWQFSAFPGVLQRAKALEGSLGVLLHNLRFIKCTRFFLVLQMI